MTELNPSQIVITGATGNTGSYVVNQLTYAGWGGQVLALVQPTSSIQQLHEQGVRTHVCDLGKPETYLPVIEPGAVFVGIANLRFSDSMLPHLKEQGVQHAFCVTTTAVFSSFHSYSRLYREIEARMKSIDMPVTILRPSMIYGNGRDHNMHRLISFIERAPVFPVFGPGTALMQPVHVEDLATGIVSAVQMRATGEYNLAGPEALTYNDVLNQVAEALGKKLRLAHLNHGVAARIVKALERVPGFPIKHEQVMRLLEDKAFDISRSVDMLNYQPRTFREGIRQQVESR
jgi:nucleoside-diphosphate-sugar epimerase